MPGHTRLRRTRPANSNLQVFLGLLFFLRPEFSQTWHFVRLTLSPAHKAKDIIKISSFCLLTSSSFRRSPASPVRTCPNRRKRERKVRSSAEKNEHRKQFLYDLWLFKTFMTMFARCFHLERTSQYINFYDYVEGNGDGWSVARRPKIDSVRGNEQGKYFSCSEMIYTLPKDFWS